MAAAPTVPPRPLMRRRAAGCDRHWPQARPSAPVRIGVSMKRYESSASPTVMASRSASSGKPVRAMSRPGRVSWYTGQCHR